MPEPDDPDSYESALLLATASVPTARAEDRAIDIRRALLGRRYEGAAEVAVCDGPRLLGLIRIEDLLAAEDGATAGELMDPDPPVVAPGIDQEAAAWKAVRHGEGSIAVVGADGRFRGLIPPRRMLGVLLHEHEEDLARMGGFLTGVRSARAAVEERLSRRLWHRLPWLVIGLAGAAVSALLMARFEEDLRATVALAFFLPGLVYLADAVGTQTETLVVRGLSVGVSVGRIVAREAVTGLALGAALASAAYPLALWGFGRADLALTVAVSIAATCSLSTLVAMALPRLFVGLGLDPAFGSGPLSTVIQDLLSVATYLTVAAALMG
jgi:magnesium transporter